MLVGLVLFPFIGRWFVSDVSESCEDVVELSSKLSLMGSGWVWAIETPFAFFLSISRPN